MKRITLATLLFFSILSVKSAFAQETLPVPNSRRPVLVDDVRQHRMLQQIASNLTPEQQNKIKGYELEKQKQLLQLNNQLDEKLARLNTLESANKPNMSTINRTIDDIAKLQAKKMKAEASYKQKIRAVLNDEQRLEFDRKQQEKRFQDNQ